MLRGKMGCSNGADRDTSGSIASKLYAGVEVASELLWKTIGKLVLVLEGACAKRIESNKEGMAQFKR